MCLNVKFYFKTFIMSPLKDRSQCRDLLPL